MLSIAEKIILEIVSQKSLTTATVDNAWRDILRTEKRKKIIPLKSELLKAYHKLVKSGKVAKNATLEKLLIKRGVRTLSGVAIVTVLTKPFPCPGKCVYCPTEARMPKSYISDEPAAARALGLKFDPFRQVQSRLDTLALNGHPTDKIELIVKGGTWNSYPLNYQYWFVLRCFEAANQMSLRGPANRRGRSNLFEFSKQRGIASRLSDARNDLPQAQKKNEKAKHRIVGLTLETRPDFVNEKTIAVMRELGCTRIELGVQTTDEKILKLIKRGHNAQAAKDATQLLKNYGFKVDYHLMPQLPGATPAKDLKMMKEIFSNPDYRPDMIKIYPCTVVENSELFEWLKKGEYKTYSDRKLIDIIKKFKTTVPYYVRISRLIRDIPSHHIKAGNKMTNLRQVIQKEMGQEGLKCNCLRCREAGHQKISNKQLTTNKIKLFINKYEAGGGTEYFLSFEDKKREMVYAFCRLRLNKKSSQALYPAFIRELHTYGQMIPISQSGDVQHLGMGKALLRKAEKICEKNKIKKLAVISGVGVRGYYRKLGYQLENGYMVKNLS